MYAGKSLLSEGPDGLQVLCIRSTSGQGCLLRGERMLADKGPQRDHLQAFLFQQCMQLLEAAAKPDIPIHRETYRYGTIEGDVLYRRNELFG